MFSRCPICNNTNTVPAVEPYLKCNDCGHEFQNIVTDSYIINDILTVAEVKKYGLLEKFKTKVLFRCAKKKNLLVDLGSASGKFLFHNKNLFKDYVGVEVTESCLLFSKNQLGLKVTARAEEIVGQEISVITFWHSLEHIPIEQIDKIFEMVRKNSTAETAVIISVPNAGSLMYKLFRERWAFYDSASHYHQFTSHSLDALLTKKGFVRQRLFGSLSYALFGYLQSLLNKFNRIHNFFYYFKKRGFNYGKSKIEIFWLSVYNICLIIVFAPMAFILTVFDVILKEKGGVLTVCYQPKKL